MLLGSLVTLREYFVAQVTVLHGMMCNGGRAE